MTDDSTANSSLQVRYREMVTERTHDVAEGKVTAFIGLFLLEGDENGALGSLAAYTAGPHRKILHMAMNWAYESSKSSILTPGAPKFLMVDVAHAITDGHVTAVKDLSAAWRLPT